MSETNEGAVATPEVSEGEGTQETPAKVELLKEEYDKLHETLGSLKRELKDLKKPKEPTDTPEKTKPDDTGLLQKAFLRAAGITAHEEVELALSTAKKWDMAVDQLVDDDDFKAKLEKVRTQKANELATSNIKGTAGTGQAKLSPDYWIAKGTPPSATDVPDRKTRAKIARAMMANEKSGKMFYND